MLGRWRGGAPDTPYMQMNAYPLEQVFGRLSVHGVSDVHVVLASESGFESALIVDTRTARAPAPEAGHACIGTPGTIEPTRQHSCSGPCGPSTL